MTQAKGILSMHSIEIQKKQITPEERDRIIKEFHVSIKPFIDIKIDILNCAIPTIVMHSDGRIERHYRRTPEVERSIKKIDECIEHIRKIHWETLGL